MPTNAKTTQVFEFLMLAFSIITPSVDLKKVFEEFNPCEDTLSEFAGSLFLPSELADSFFLYF